MLAAQFQLMIALAIGVESSTLRDPPRSSQDTVDRVIVALNTIEQHYRHVRLTTRETQREYITQSVKWVTENEYLVDQDLFRVSVTYTESNDPARKVGETLAFGGSTAKYFRVRRRPGASDFLLTAFGQKPNENFQLMALDKARPAFAPYCIFGARVVDYLRFDGVRVIDVSERELDGDKVIAILTEYRFDDSEPGGPGVVRYRLYFDAASLLMRGFVLYREPDNPSATFAEQRVTYVPGTNPAEVARVEVWSGSPAEPDVKSGGTLRDVTSITFGKIDAGAFTLSAFGLEEPIGGGESPLPATGSGSSRLAVIGVLGLAIVGVVLAILGVKRRGRLRTET